MIIIHGALSEGSLYLWGEIRRTGASSGSFEGVHPFAASAKEIASLLGIKVNKRMIEEQFVWLPSSKTKPTASSPLLEQGDCRGEIKVLPWQVETLSLNTAQVIALSELFGTEGESILGLLPAPSLRYCLQVARFSLSLAIRQQVIPALNDEGTQACWKPIFLGADKESVKQLADQMPMTVRAVNGDKERAPMVSPYLHLTSFVEAITDEVVRPLKSPKVKIPKKTNEHRQWVQGLFCAKKNIGIDSYSSLPETLCRWKRPLVELSNATHHLAFRLEEPNEEKDPWVVRPLLQEVADQSLLIEVKEAWKAKSTLGGLKTFILSELGHAGVVSPPLQAVLKGKKPTLAKLDGQGALEFLGSGAGALEQAGFRVLLPSWWTRTGTKQRLVARGKARSASSKSAGLLSMESMVKFSWELAIGGEAVSREELERLAKAKSPLIKVRGQWVHVSVDQIQTALDFWKKKSGEEELSLSEVMRLSLGLDKDHNHGDLPVGEIEGVGRVGKFLQQFKDANKLELVSAPKDFVATLRPYQERGYSWLSFLRQLGLGACLADDMGLGKTIQALALLQQDVEKGNTSPVLLICPTSLLGNWQREAAKFTPSLGVEIHYGSNRPKTLTALKKSLKKKHLLITSYGLLQRDLALMSKVDWQGVILDEAQNIKNHNTRQAKAARSLSADYRIALSGTPVENHVGELWSIMEFLNPGMLGTQAHFDRTFFKPIQRDHDQYAMELLGRATGPFLLRRLKTDRSIINDLPDKIENIVHCQLSKEQGSLYAAALKEADEQLEGAEDGIKRKGVILGLLSRLKQICNHPAQFLGDHSSIDGRSGKLTRLTEMMGEVLEGGERALVFTQFTEMGGMLKSHLEEQFGREVLFLKGSVSKKKRDEMVQRFQEDDDAPPIFLLSLRAGGTGLTLTRANHVFHFDRWWNPAVEDQATDRAFRIGQKKNVQVHKFVCIGTLEERISQLIHMKKELAEKIVGSGEGWISKMSNQDLKELIALGKDAVIDQ